MNATLYIPGQAAQLITLTANTAEAAAVFMGLAPQLVDVLAGDQGDGLTVLPAGYTVYAHGDVDDDTPLNEEGSAHIERLIGAWCDMVAGPIVIVQD